MTKPETMIVRPEHIYIGFFRALFGQAKLYQSIPNEFEWVDNREENTLVIESSGVYGFDTVDSLPSIVVQSNGFDEREETMDRRVLHDFHGYEKHLTNYMHRHTFHCLARRRGASRLLQNAVTRGIGMFRKMIYQMGVEKIFPLQGRPPQLLEGRQDIPGAYDSAVTTRTKMRQNWFLQREGDPEEEVRIQFHAALEEVELDDQGNPKNPDEVISQEAFVDNST
ncbi:MAG: hypothetical protein ABEN55_16570 [Bradymonadaceae bacterium]